MEIQIILLFLALAFISEVAGTIGGFGSSVFFVPLASFFFDFKIALALTGILHVFSNIAKLIIFRRDIDIKLFFQIGIPGLLMVIAGAFLTTLIKIDFSELLLAVFLILFSISMLLNPEFKITPTLLNSVSGGSVSGFLAGFIGTGGVIRGLFLSAYGLPKNTFIATSAAIDMGIDFSRMALYLNFGYMSRQLYILIPFLILIAFAGSYTGKIILNKIPESIFKKIVLLLICGVGFAILIKHLFN